jgi:hypothetical protein
MQTYVPANFTSFKKVQGLKHFLVFNLNINLFWKKHFLYNLSHFPSKLVFVTENRPNGTSKMEYLFLEIGHIGYLKIQNLG